MDTENYAASYSDDSFWSKIKTYASSIGQDLLGKALTLYHTLQDADTPMWAKGVITGALGYLILPMDLVSDLIPGLGYTDDAGALAAALAVVATHIKQVHKDKAAAQLKTWFE